jgi:SWI/SNF-related matrix-associated actin-dependent regulator 1 of chromatin subfamily A
LGIQKLPHIIEHAEKVLKSGEKIIIFAHHREVVQRLQQHFGKRSVMLIGGAAADEVTEIVDEFQTNDKIKVFVGNLKAAGVGLTLTAAEVVIMNDLSFVPSDHSQGEDRSYRYGQKNNVLVYYPIFENTIEGVIYDILSKKKSIINTVMGDTIDKADFVEEIMSIINPKS